MLELRKLHNLAELFQVVKNCQSDLIYLTSYNVKPAKTVRLQTSQFILIRRSILNAQVDYYGLIGRNM